MFQGGKIAGPMEFYWTDLLRDRERHRNVIVKLSLDIGPAEMAVIMIVKFVHSPKAFNHARARWAQEHPIHLN